MGIWQSNLLGGRLRAVGAWLALAVCAHGALAQELQQPRSLGEVGITAEDRAALTEPVAPSPPPFSEEEADWLPQFTLPHPDLWEELWAPGLLVEDTYWLQRPWSAGFMVGTMTSGDLTNQITEASDWYWGLRLGNDFAPHWGWELRSAFFSPDLHYAPPRVPFPGITNDWFLDLNVLHYPWGDTRWRPYWSLGLGAAQYDFNPGNGVQQSEWVVDLPIALGCKYYWTRAIVLRGELGNTTTFGNNTINALNHVTFNLGAEIHWHSFKTRPVKYGY